MRFAPPSVDLTALRSPAFRLIALAQLGFVLGEQVLVVAVTVSVLGAGGDAATVGVVLAAKGIASLCLLLPGGVWSDRLPRRRILTVMLVVDAITAGVPLLVTGSLWPAAVMFVLGAAEAFIRPALNAVLAGVLEEGQRVSGRALVNICTRLGVVTGPVAGTLLAGGSMAFPFVLAALVFAASAFAFRRLAEPSWTPVARRSLLKEAMAGFADAGRRPWLTALLLFSPISLMFVIAPSQVLLPVLSRDTFGSFTAYGTALACYGAGGLISSVTMMAWRPRRPGVVAMCAMASYALVPLGLLYAPSVWILFCCYLVAGFGVETYALCWDVAMYREVPDHLIGRITSLAWLSTFGLMPFGQALTGPLTDLAGDGAVLLTAAGLVLVIPPCLLLVAGMPHLRGTRTPRTTSGPPA
ncbi:MFS transporter [Nonomuraea wenchangensis]|uniref:Predicted arabinose efflux permease, MFS family n=2 Tax=Nonomuraea wenchangensis TaxID=568860 RepID=A0A1I0LQ85_9ACTN|nr:MFS transporter [Nonomuraea wenchangensis]SEU44116.1 Predicted arabinose efflux permease, MFS family [Nonomuraea wenchangensis]